MQVCVEGNHDNPLSGNHQVPSHWISQRKKQILTDTNLEGGEGWEQKAFSTTVGEEQRKQNGLTLTGQSCKFTETLWKRSDHPT